PSFISSFLSTHTPTSAIFTLSLHDALPISFLATTSVKYIMESDGANLRFASSRLADEKYAGLNLDTLARFGSIEWRHALASTERDRKSTRLNSSHVKISYAVFCLKKKSEHP